MSAAEGDIYEGMIQGARRWVIAATGLSGKLVIPADDDGMRPKSAFVTIGIPSGDNVIGQDERLASINDQTGSPQVDVQGMRQATLMLNGYGRGSDNFLTKCALSLQLPSILQLLYDNQMSVRPISELIDLSQLEDGKIEKRFAREFQIQYLLRTTEPEQMVEAMNFDLAMSLASDAAESSGLDDLVLDIVIEC